MSSNEPSLLLRLNLIVSDITDRVNAGAVEILEIVSKYEEELCLAKEEIVRQRKLLDALQVQDMTDRMNAPAVPQQHTTPTPDVQCSELQHSPDLPACEQKIPPEQRLGDEEASLSDNPHVSVYSVSLTNLQFQELNKSVQTGNGDHPDHCHEGEEFGRPLEAHDVSQMDLGLIKEEEEPMSNHTGAERCQSTPDATEDHAATSNSRPGFKAYTTNGNRGGKVLIYNNYRYVRAKTVTDRIYWRCARKLECRANLHTNVFTVDSDEPQEIRILSKEPQHRHAGETELVQRSAFTNRVLTAVANNPTNSLTRVYKEAVSNALVGEGEIIREYKSLRTMLNRERSRHLPKKQTLEGKDTS